MRGTSIHAAFRYFFGLRNREAEVLCLLYSAGGAMLRGDQLGPGAYEHVRIIRETMDAESIDTTPSVGYRLTDEGLAECRSALRQTGAELLAA